MAQASRVLSPPPHHRPPPFNPVDTAATLNPVEDEVESPSISNQTALARFEFESGHGREGTKILMVEWEEDPQTQRIHGDWHISWEGKTHVLTADDQRTTGNNGSGPALNRMYFLLLPGVNVPAIVTLTLRPRDEGVEPVVWRTNPLPAIFPPELGGLGRMEGKKGVLHTIWAKKRLQALQGEIELEARNNAESVGLIMAVQEKEWIEQNFGVTARPSSAASPQPATAEPSPSLLSPASPKSPSSGRLMDKLKGLKLGTSDEALKPGGGTPPPQANPLSPETSDVAVSSFAALKGPGRAPPAAHPAPQPQGSQPVPQLQAPSRRAAPILPPHSVAQQQAQAAGMASLNALAGPGPSFGIPPAAGEQDEDDREDGLFALPISPRSPEMSKSPFSFASSDTIRHLKGERAL